MSLTLKSLKTKLFEKPVKNLYFLMGEETYLIREALKEIKKHSLKGASEDFNYHVFRAGECEVEKLKETVQTLPVFSEKRMVLCEQAERFNEKDLKLLKTLMEEPAPACVLVFVSSAPDKRKKAIKTLMQFCETMSAGRPKDSEWSLWVDEMAKQQGIKLSGAAVSVLRQYAGYDLMSIEHELQKLSQVFDRGHVIGAEDVLKVVPRIRPENIFALSKAIATQKLSEALCCLSRLLEDNQSEIGVLSLVLRHIRILARIKEGVKKGYTERTLAQRTGLPLFFVREYILEADMWQDKKITSTLQTLYLTDKALKSSPLPSHIWLENLILKTCS